MMCCRTETTVASRPRGERAPAVVPYKDVRSRQQIHSHLVCVKDKRNKASVKPHQDLVISVSCPPYFSKCIRLQLFSSPWLAVRIPPPSKSVRISAGPPKTASRRVTARS